MIWLKEMDMFEEALKEQTGIEQHYMIVDVETVDRKQPSSVLAYMPCHIVNDYIVLGSVTNQLYRVRHIHRFSQDIDDEAIMEVVAI